MRRWLVLALVLVAVPASAKDLYVNNSGTPACSDATTYANNDAASPWCTINRAAWGSTNRAAPNADEAAQAGDTVYITAGTYANVKPESAHWAYVAYNPINSGTSGNPIVFEAVGEVILTQNGSPGLDGTATGRAVIGASDQGPGTGHRSYITWRGFTINEVDVNSANGVALIAGGTGIVLEGLTLNGGGDAVASSNNHPGIYLDGVTIQNAVIRNNRVFNWKNNGSYHRNGAGIMIYRAQGTLIEHNEFTDNGSGVFVKGYEHKSTTVRYNLLVGNRYQISGMYHDTDSEFVDNYYQNIVRCTAGRDERYGIWITEYAGNIRVVNNTIVDCHELAVGAFSDPYPTSLLIQNNLVYQSQGYSLGFNNNPMSAVLLDRNNYYSIANFTGATSSANTLAGWRTLLGGCPNTGNECASTTEDPLFVDASEHDYRLQDESPVRTLGRTITAIHGSDGETIPAGAYITGEEIIGPTEGETPTPTDPVRWRVRFRAGSLELGSLAVALVWWLRRRRAQA